MKFPWFNKTRRSTQRPCTPPAVVETRPVEVPGVGVIEVARTVNCIGDGCPRPQLLTLKALNQLPPGSVVELVSDNPTAVETIPAMMLAAYGSHLATVREDAVWRVYVRKGD